MDRPLSTDRVGAHGGGGGDGDIRLRRPVEADHAAVVGRIDEWWGGRRVHQVLPRFWFQHFTGTSWIAEAADGRLLGFLVGFVSPDRPDVAQVHLAGVDPNRRRTGIGRRLYERFLADVASRGVREVRALAWPDDRRAVAFHRALGFRPDDGPGTVAIHGVPAHPDHDHERADRVVFLRDL